MCRMSRFILAGGGALLALTAPVFATIYYVDESNPPGTHPAPWNATVSLQTALAAVGSLQNDEVRIAKGTYLPGSTSSDTFVLMDDVIYSGGWDPATNTYDPAANPTVLDGRYLNNHVVSVFNAGRGIDLSGVTIRRGDPGASPAGPNQFGGGLLIIDDGGMLNMFDCVVEDNRGGGIGNDEASLNQPKNTLTLIRCLIQNNTGGGISSENDVSVIAHQCTFLVNDNDVGGAIDAPGLSTVFLTECLFQANSASSRGGAVHTTSVTMRISDCVFVGNTTGNVNVPSGGAIFSSGSVEIDRCTFVGNHAGRFGGAVRVGDNAVIANSLFNNNTVNFGTVDDGGAIYANSGTTTPDIQIVNCTIVNNSAFSGAGGVWTDGEVHNCIIWNNTSVTGTEPNIHLRQVAPIQPSVLTYCDIAQFVAPGVWGSTNINSDPRFTDIDGADGVLGNLDDDYRLLSVLNSPCIDAGSNPRITGALPFVIPLLDLDKHGRFFDDSYTTDTGAGTAPIVDMGCYEMDDPCTGGCPGDLSRDGIVDVDDLNLVLSNWNTSVGPCGPGDANGDGFVDVDDLNLVLSNWEKSCGGTGTQQQEQGQQQSMMQSDESDESESSDLPLDLQSLGFTTREEYRVYLEELSPIECFLHAFDVLEAHEAICGDAGHE